MHSFLVLFGLSFFTYIIFPDITPYFFVGFISHMVIDAFNGKREKVFWPLGKGFALRLCTANVLVNKLLFHISNIAILLLILTSRPVQTTAMHIFRITHR